MSKKIETVIVVICKGKPEGDPIIGRVKNHNSLGKIVFFKDLLTVELPDVGDEVEVFIIREFDKALQCVFHEDTAKELLNQKFNHSDKDCSIIPEKVKKPERKMFNRKIYELTDVEEVNDFLEERYFKLVSASMVNNEIVYVIHRVE